jgi:hypothetical protein
MYVVYIRYRKSPNFGKTLDLRPEPRRYQTVLVKVRKQEEGKSKKRLFSIEKEFKIYRVQKDIGKIWRRIYI